MKTRKLSIILQSIFMAIAVCVSVIFVIKYTFDIKLIKDSNYKATEDATQATNNDETLNDDNNENETIEEDIPFTERTYEVNGIVFDNNALLLPCEYYNNAIINNDALLCTKAYPEYVINYIQDTSDFETIDDYISSLHDAYVSTFGSYFTFNNVLVNTTILSDDEINDMNMYFKKTYSEDVHIEYAVLMESVCSIHYQNDELDLKMNTASETEYFTSYYSDGNWYIDYQYTDYYFFNN